MRKDRHEARLEKPEMSLNLGITMSMQSDNGAALAAYRYLQTNTLAFITTDAGQPIQVES